MDPVSAISLAAGTAQFLDIGGKALVGTLTLLRDLRDTPSWIRDLSNNIEKSFQHIQILRETIERSGFEDLVQPNYAQVRTASDAVRNAYDAIVDLKEALEPYSRDQVLLTQKRWRRIWTAVSSVTERSSIEQKMQKVMLLNHEVSQALQVIQLGMQKAMK
jgi:beta-phosphoglucomutase-like phosphatase (HAD superfamily)